MRLYRHKDNTYTFVDESEAKYYGDLKTICLTMYRCGVEWNEIELGITTMLNNKHTLADYGINKTFIFTSET